MNQTQRENRNETKIGGGWRVENLEYPILTCKSEVEGYQFVIETASDNSIAPKASLAFQPPVGAEIDDRAALNPLLIGLSAVLTGSSFQQGQ